MEGVHGVRGWRWEGVGGCLVLKYTEAIIQIYIVHVHTELATSYSLRVPTPPAHCMAQELGMGDMCIVVVLHHS